MDKSNMNMRAFPRVTLDRQAVELALLFVAVLAPVVAIATHLGPDAAATVSPPGGVSNDAGGQAAAGGGFVLLEVAFAALLLAGYAVYRKLPEWAQDAVETSVFGALLIWLGATYGLATVPLFVGLYVGARAVDRLGLWWVPNNLAVVLAAILYSIVLALVFGVVGTGIFLAGMTVYDHVFANKKTWMFKLVRPLLRWRIPVLFVRPATLRFEWDDVAGELDADGDAKDGDAKTWGLGLGDLMLPGAFVAAVVMEPPGALLAGGLPIALACVAGILVACARLRYELLSSGSGAGLPALATGVLAPYVVLSMAAVVMA